MRPERIPLFPLNVVLLPGAALPLHIFEPRYRHMVKNCLKEKFEFGMLLSLPKGVVRVGCTAEIAEVAKRYDDGRMDILAIGRAPFRAIELFTENPLLEACHTLIYDDYPNNLERTAPEQLSYLVAGTLPMELLWKQQILELRSETDRQERLVAYLRAWAPHLQKSEAMRQHAGGNGHGLN